MKAFEIGMQHWVAQPLSHKCKRAESGAQHVCGKRFEMARRDSSKKVSTTIENRPSVGQTYWTFSAASLYWKGFGNCPYGTSCAEGMYNFLKRNAGLATTSKKKKKKKKKIYQIAALNGKKIPL